MKVREPCIYRVPSRIRDVKPEAYTPRMVVIGPLHRSLKSTARDGAETSSNLWHLKKEYIKMEDIKKKYLESYTKIVGKVTIEEMRKIIQAEEKNIRASYEELAEWIPSESYVELILHDSVFIMEFFRRYMKYCEYSDAHSEYSDAYSEYSDAHSEYSVLDAHSEYSDDWMVDEHVHFKYSYSDGLMIRDDLILLENQLPFFILDSLFSSNMKELYISKTIDQVILSFYGLYIEEKTNFKHFTDMLRCAYEESLEDIPKQQIKMHPRRNQMNWPPITELWNAEALSRAGVDFKEESVIEERKFLGRRGVTKSYRKRFEDFSLHVEFQKGSLKMPALHADEETDMYLRNVIAFEQCHDDVIPFTSNYIHFLNFLITSNRDVQLLSEAGVVTNTRGRPSFVVDMVNKLQVGVKVGDRSQYHDVAKNLKAHYKSRRKMCWATLRKVYFSDLWTGTATLAAVLLLFLTLVGTVASVIEAYKSF